MKKLSEFLLGLRNIMDILLPDKKLRMVFFYTLAGFFVGAISYCWICNFISRM